MMNITGISDDIKKLKFVEDSAVKTIFGHAFLPFSEINEIYFPTSLKELKEGWCCDTGNLTKIIISPMNGQFRMNDDKYLIGKSDSKKDEFDILLFASRDIKEISIPSNIKIISSFAFQNCQKLTKVEIPSNSNLQTIESNAFSFSNINEIYFPSKVSKIDKQAFSFCSNLTKIEFPPNSNLQTIESDAFSNSNIKDFIIPSKVSKICQYAFYDCRNFQIIEISEESNLESFPMSAFDELENIIVMIPSSLKKLIHL